MLFLLPAAAIVVTNSVEDDDDVVGGAEWERMCRDGEILLVSRLLRCNFLCNPNQCNENAIIIIAFVPLYFHST